MVNGYGKFEFNGNWSGPKIANGNWFGAKIFNGNWFGDPPLTPSGVPPNLKKAGSLGLGAGRMNGHVHPSM